MIKVSLTPKKTPKAQKTTVAEVVPTLKLLIQQKNKSLMKNGGH